MVIFLWSSGIRLACAPAVTRWSGGALSVPGPGIEQAELVLAVFDASRPLDAEDKTVCEYIDGKQIVPILNKIDLSAATTADGA